MILRPLRILTAGLLLALAAGAQAQGEDPKPWYVAGGLGATWTDDMSLSGTLSGNVNFNPGYTGNVSVGRYLDDERVLRLEVEGIYAHADVNKFGTTNAGGYVENASLMVNFLYDIQTGTPWVPFLGGGLGYSRVGMSNFGTAGGTLVDDSTNAFAYQFKGGVAYQFNPNMAVTVLYRYFATDNLSFGGSGAATGTVKSGGVRSHNAELGFRYNF